jgi:tight adherence protein B
MPQLLVLIAAACLFSFTLAVALIQGVFGKRIEAKARIRRLVRNDNDVQQRKTRVKKSDLKQEKPSAKGKILDGLLTELSCAGIKLRAEESLVIWTGLTLGPLLLALIFRADFIVCLGLSISGFMLPLFYVRRRKAQRIAMIEEQLSSALIVIGNCLQTGLSLQQALESIVREMPEPISKEFGRVTKEMQLGLSMEKALENMSNRIKSKDFMLIVSAILIQRQSGGNLSEILQNISDTIQERLRIKANLRVLTTTGRTSAKVVGLMPVFIMLILMVLNPAYIRTFFESQTGINLLIIAVALEITGFFAVKRVIRVKF